MIRVSGYRKVVVAAVLAVLCALAAFPAAVMAIADPNSEPQVNAVYVYEDLLESGDMGVLVEYALDYDPVPGIPDETVTDAYIVIFVDTDNTTQLKSIAPYAFDGVNKGYGRGLAWLHFDSSEVAAYGLDSSNMSLYHVWLSGNPTLSWSGDPPKTEAGIDYWQPAGSSASTLLGLRVLYYAQKLEEAWSENLIEETATGSKLTSDGESYFVNVIPNLRTIAPNVFSSGEYGPTLEDEVDYTTTFGATLTNGTGVATGSPITLSQGSNTVTVTTAGTFTIELNKGTVGTASSDTGTVTGSPVDLTYGTNTITVPVGGTGDITITVNLENLQTALEDTVTGTGLDLTDAATKFGMSRMMFSGLVWLGVTIVICAAVYRAASRGGYGSSGGKVVIVIFSLCIIGGTVLGLVHPIISALLFIGFGGLVGYVLFFRRASI